MFRIDTVKWLCCFVLIILVLVSSVAIANPSQATSYVLETSTSHGLPQLSEGSGPATQTAIPSGEITVDTTWTEEQSPYIIIPSAYGAYIRVIDGVTLTIEPGVQVLLPQNADFTVYGTLKAVGTAEKPILFQPTTPGANGFWNQLWLGGGSVMTDSDNTHLSYVTIEGGGSRTSASVYVGESSPTLDHITIRQSGSDGLYANRGSLTIDTATIENNASDGIYLNATSAPRLLNVTVRNNGGIAVQQYPADMSPTYRHLSFSGNSTDAIIILSPESDGRHFINSGRSWSLGQARVPIHLAGSIVINHGAFLSLEPGTHLRFTTGGGLAVAGSLYGLGTATNPITLTSFVEQPGAWEGVTIGPSARAILQHCSIGYGGKAVATLQLQSSNSIVQNCHIHHSIKDGVYVQAGAQPILVNNQIEGNAFGLRNERPGIVVDARNTWWGDASGPYHPTLNPNGRGNAVSDGVRFDPWLLTPSEGSETANRLILEVGGPGNVSPGETVDYAVQYINQSSQTIENAVLMLALPDAADYLEDTGGGTFWPQRHQVFWKLGNIAPGSAGFVSVRVRYAWGLPDGYQDSALALLGGTNAGQDVFDVRPYLAYVPVMVVQETILSADQVIAERRAHGEVEQLYQQALGEGFIFDSATRERLNSGEEFTALRFSHPVRDAVLSIWRKERQVQAFIVGPTFFTIRNTTGGMTYDRTLESRTFFGAWATDSIMLQQTGPSKDDCMRNCISKLGKDFLLKKIILRRVMGRNPKKVPGVSDIKEMIECKEQCDKDPTSHYCTKNKRFCDQVKQFFGVFGPTAAHRIMEWECDTETGNFEPNPKFVSQCDLNGKCVEGSDGEPMCIECEQQPQQAAQHTIDLLAMEQQLDPTSFPSALSKPRTPLTSAEATVCARLAANGGTCAQRRSAVSMAHDPNAKYGPMGDLVPGQPVTYAITYENEGAGRAYGVFVVDQLSEHFDEHTLMLHTPGTFLTDTHTILWEVDELAPKGENGSTGVLSFTVQLKRNLPSGTTIMNQAVVHFPSVPEETPTNPVVSVVQPVAALPQRIEVEAGQTVTLALEGREVSNGPLSFSLTEGPLYGTVTGIAPNLSYTAPANFSGLDRISFTASNGISTSRPADVTLVVLPSPNDTTAPTVRWTAPSDGAQLPAVRTTPLLTDTLGAAYTPLILVHFSEPISTTTLTTATVRLTRDDGRGISISLSYDGTLEELTLIPREPLLQRTRYTLTLTRDIKDLNGNGLAANYSVAFRTGPVDRRVYLPILRR